MKWYERYVTFVAVCLLVAGPLAIYILQLRSERDYAREVSQGLYNAFKDEKAFGPKQGLGNTVVLYPDRADSVVYFCEWLDHSYKPNPINR